jgi:hypothetical protein
MHGAANDAWEPKADCASAVRVTDEPNPGECNTIYCTGESPANATGAIHAALPRAFPRAAIRGHVEWHYQDRPFAAGAKVWVADRGEIPFREDTKP